MHTFPGSGIVCLLCTDSALKYKSIIHNSRSSSERVHHLLSSHIKIHQHSCLDQFWTVLDYKVLDLCIFYSWFRWGDKRFEVKNVLMMDLLLTYMQLFTSQDIICGLDSCGLHMISCSDSHSDGTHSLQRIHWWANDVMLNFRIRMSFITRYVYTYKEFVSMTEATAVQQNDSDRTKNTNNKKVNRE